MQIISPLLTLHQSLLRRPLLRWYAKPIGDVLLVKDTSLKFSSVMTGDKPILSYILWVVWIPPTLPLVSYWNVTKQDDMEFKDWIAKKNIKLVWERLRICTWRTGDRVIIVDSLRSWQDGYARGSLLAEEPQGKISIWLTPKLVAAPALGRQKTATLPCQSREPRRLVHRIP